MKLGRIVIVNEILVTQMNHWGIFPIAAAVMGIAEKFTQAKKPDLLIWVLCGLFPVFFFIIREAAERFWLFFLLHLGGFSAAFVFPVQNEISRGIALFCGAFYLCRSFYLRFSSHSDGYDEAFSPAAAILLSAASLLVQHYQGIPSWDFYYVASLIFVLGSYFICYYLEQYQRFLRVNANSAGYLPEKEMFRSGMGLVLAYTLGSAVLLFSAANIQWLAFFFDMAKEILRRVLVFLTSILPDSEPESSYIFQEPVLGGGMELPAAAKGSPFWDVLLFLVTSAISLSFAALFCKAVKKLYLFLLEQFANKNADKIRENVPGIFDVREKCDMIRTVRQKGRSSFSFLSPAERVRRLYKKRIMSDKIHLKEELQGQPEFCTAREYACRISLPQMAEIYERARYSDLETDAGDVKRMKEICKNRKIRNGV